MIARPSTIAAALALALAGCAPTGQLLLYVDTDAWVPAAHADPPAADRPPALFDRLRVDVLRATDDPATPFATRDFVVDEGRFRALQISVGVAPSPDDPTLRARLRLFRGDRLMNDEPPLASTLDTTVQLPALGATEHRAVTVRLLVADVGSPLGADTPIAPDDGAPTSSLVGTWPGTIRVPCVGTPGAEEVCVPGGAFWLGDPQLVTTGDDPPAGEQLVVVSPFFLDTSEVTVGSFRAHAGDINSRYLPTRRDPSGDLSSIRAWCTYTDQPQGLEALPVTCLAASAATMYCGVLGKQLPTEAQYEFVASGRGAELEYPWGDDAPGCADAVWGLGGGGGPTSIEFSLSDPTCRAAADIGGPRPSGQGARDRIAFGAATVLDLAGNVAEWVVDTWQPLGQGVWGQPGVLADPVEQTSDPDAPQDVSRGGSWRGGTYDLRAGSRTSYPHNSGAHDVGFRCARKGG